MKNVFLKVSLISVVGVVACQNVGQKESKSGSSRPVWVISVEDEAPKLQEGSWKRVLRLSGGRHSQILVDKQFRNSDNWFQVGLTDDSGKFYDSDIAKDARYRFGGIFITPWYDSFKTLFITNEQTLPAKIEGDVCTVEKDVTLYIEDKTLEINCREVNIYGNIISFLKRAQVLGTSGRNAGALKITAETIDVQGHVWLDGEIGAFGRSTPGFWGIRDGHSGGNGGNGGSINLSYKELHEVYESFRFEGGAGGPPGTNGNPNRHPISGLSGTRGTIVRTELK